MAYLGKSPTEVFRAFSVKDTFTGDGSTTVFTLSRAAFIGSPNDVQVFVDNVRQEPGSGKAYTIALDGSSNATQLTFTAAPPSGTDNIYVIFRQKATVRTNTADKYNATLFQNPRTITEDIAVDTGFNACIAGPVTVSAGVTLGVPTNSRLVIV